MSDFGTLSIYMFVISRRNEARTMRKVTLDRRYGLSRDEALEYLDRFKEENPGLKVEASYIVETFLT